MANIAAVALLVGLGWAAVPAAAQSLSSREPPLPLDRRGLEFPVNQYIDERGAVQRRRGIVLGTEIAPDTMLGVGMFDRMPKSRGLTPQLDPPQASRKTRGAAVGLTLKF